MMEVKVLDLVQVLALLINGLGVINHQMREREESAPNHAQL
jgi:hypothetical protein